MPPADLTVAALVLLVLFGLIVGSFLNVVIVRMPVDESLMRPPSKCPQCEAPIRPLDNIPVLSYVLLRGRCRSCQNPIPIGYPLVELMNAVLWLVAGLRFGATWALIPFLLLFSTLLVQSVIDLELYRLLDKITFPVLGASAVLVAVISLGYGEAHQIVLALAGAVGYFVFLFIPAFLYPKGMGLGDVKLAALMGLYLGWIHPILILFALIAACLLGIIAGLVVFFARGRKSAQFPFGPWLALGCVVIILFSNPILDAYQSTTAAFLS